MTRPGTARLIGRAVFFLGVVCAAAAAPAHAAGDAAKGAARAATCESCHGTPERAPLPGTPYLAGQQDDFLMLQMFLFREGLREVPQMAGLFKGVTDYDFMDMAAYFSRQTPPRVTTTPDLKLRARGAELAKAMGCGTCHLANFRGQKQIPRLDRQREDYLANALKAYRDNKRTGSDTSMNGLMYRVSDGDIHALAHFLAHR